MYEVREQLPGIMGGLLNDHYKPSIVTGVAALVRSAELQNLLKATQEIQVIVPTLTQIDPRLDPQKILDVIMNANSVNLNLIMKSQEQLKKEAEQQKAQADAAELQQTLLQQGGSQSLEGVINNV